MFSGNGASDSNQGASVINAGGSFNPAVLGPTPDAFGNFTGNPAFVTPRDPRPNGDGPGDFFQEANFDLTAASAAIDAALPSITPASDLLYRGRVRISGRGFPGTGPGDVGAFEFEGTAGTGVGGAFRVASSSLAAGGAALAGGSPITPAALGKSITFDFSWAVDQSTVNPNDLVISGTAVDPSNPVHATSVTWIDAHTVQFNLSGNYNSTGSLNVSLSGGGIQSVDHQSLQGFADSVQVVPTLPNPLATPTASPTPSPTPTATPSSALAPAPAPTSNHPHAKSKHKHKPVHHVVHKHAAVKHSAHTAKHEK
jgi:hypothetical protein